LSRFFSFSQERGTELREECTAGAEWSGNDSRQRIKANIQPAFAILPKWLGECHALFSENPTRRDRHRVQQNRHARGFNEKTRLRLLRRRGLTFARLRRGGWSGNNDTGEKKREGSR